MDAMRSGAGWMAAVLFLASATARGGAVPPPPTLASPDVIESLAVDPYTSDPHFNGGEYIDENFSGDSTQTNQYFAGKKVARLDGGDIVVAALVKRPNGNQTNGLWNIGLVRYSADGRVRRTWSAADPEYSLDGGQYIVYPNSDSARFAWIQNIAVVRGVILVAVNYNFNDTGDVDTRILMFEENGTYLSTTAAFAEGSDVGEYVGGMAVYDIPALGDPIVYVAATRVPPGGFARPIFRRYALTPSLALDDQTGVVPLATDVCVNTAIPCGVRGLALGNRGIAQPTLYVVYTLPCVSYAACVVVSKLTPSGAAAAGWAPVGPWFEPDSQGGGDSTDPVALGVRTTGLGQPGSPYEDEVYVAANVDRNCADGIGILRFTADDPSPVGVVVGGLDLADPTLCMLANAPADAAIDLAVSGDRTAIVGIRTTRGTGGAEDDVDGHVLIVRSDFYIGALELPYPVAGLRERHSGLWGVVPTGGGRFVATGDLRWPDSDDVFILLRGKTRVGTVGIGPDRIFGDGYELP